MQEFDEYHGTKIIKTEAEALLDLELQLGEIPVKPPIDPYKSDFGFVVLDGCIRQLSLDERGLQYFPDSIGALAELRTLSAVDNSLTVLTDTIGNLSSLQKLNLIRNDLTYLPSSIGGISGSSRIISRSK